MLRTNWDAILRTGKDFEDDLRTDAITAGIAIDSSNRRAFQISHVIAKPVGRMTKQKSNRVSSTANEVRKYSVGAIRASGFRPWLRSQWARLARNLGQNQAPEIVEEVFDGPPS